MRFLPVTSVKVMTAPTIRCSSSHIGPAERRSAQVSPPGEGKLASTLRRRRPESGWARKLWTSGKRSLAKESGNIVSKGSSSRLSPHIR